MESVIRAVITYLFFLVVIRFSGRRTIGEMTNFDFVLLLLISEAAQGGLTGDDFSMTNSMIVITTLIFLDILFSLIKSKSQTISKVVDGVPTILIYEGSVQKENIKHSRTDLDDIMDAARTIRGLERMEQIKYAILERNGKISIIPYENNN